MFGARGLAPRQAAYWEEALARTVTSDEWKQRMEANQLQTRFMRGTELAGYLQGEYEATRLVMADLGLSK
jgi:putative tricarboxylic transport membrane protein